MPSARAVLLSTIRDELLPYLYQYEFIRLDIPASDRDAETERMFPLGYMRRVRGTYAHLLEIQFDRWGSAKFVINFGVVPPEGATLPWEHYEQNETRL